MDSIQFSYQRRQNSKISPSHSMSNHEQPILTNLPPTYVFLLSKSHIFNTIHQTRILKHFFTLMYMMPPRPTPNSIRYLLYATLQTLSSSNFNNLGNLITKLSSIHLSFQNFVVIPLPWILLIIELTTTPRFCNWDI